MEIVADILARCLIQAGMDVVFGLPGGETVEVLDALRRRDIGFVLVHRECAAAFMASAASRLGRRPAACLTTLGPGATNAVTGVAHAFLDRAPILVITAETSERLRPHHTHQVLDLKALYASITKASLSLKPEGAEETVLRALALASAGRRGPVHLRLSNEDARQAAVPREYLGSEAEDSSRRTGGDIPGQLETAFLVLSRSRRPVIVVGLGVEPEAPYEELRHFGESARAPIIVTPKAKGAIPDDHPLAAGAIGLTQTDPVYEVLEEADSVFAVGLDVVELVRPWSHPAPLVWIAPWRNEDPKLPAVVEIVRPMKPVLERLAAAPASTDPGWGAPRVATHRRSLAPRVPPEPTGRFMTPQSVLGVLRDQLPREAVVTTDVGSHKILSCLEWPAYVPNRFLVSNGLSSMGYALPAAIASSLVHPDLPVLCITGDAGLAMGMGELGTLARCGGSVIVAVFKDNALDLIRSHQRRSGKPVFGTEFNAPDFVRIADAHRVQAYRASTEESLAEGLERSMASRRPAVIEIAVDPSTYPTTPAG